MTARTSAGAASVASWVGHRAVPVVITEAARLFGDHDQLAELDDVEALQLCYRLWSMTVGTTPGEAAAMPDWLHPDRWVDHDAWWGALTSGVRLGQLATDVGVVLARGGVLPWPLWPGDLAVIAFAILRAGDMPWSKPAEVLADLLQPAEPVWAARTGESRIRPGIRGQGRRDLDRWIVAVEDWVAGGPPPPKRPLGGRAKTPREVATEKRRGVVRDLLAEWPQIRPRDFRFETSGKKSMPAVKLNAAMVAAGLDEFPSECFYRTGRAAERFRDLIADDLAYWRSQKSPAGDSASLPTRRTGATVDPWT